MPGLQTTADELRLLVILALLPINIFELFGEIFLEYWLSNFQVYVELKYTNCYSSVSLSAVPLLDIKKSILVTADFVFQPE